MKITDQIHALKIPFQIRDPSGLMVPRFVYVYVIRGEETCLVDGGVASSERIIADYLRETDRAPENISRLILTHGHPDHNRGRKGDKRDLRLLCGSHPAYKDWIEDTDQQERERPVPGFEDLVGGSVLIDEILRDGDVLDLGSWLKSRSSTPQDTLQARSRSGCPGRGSSSLPMPFPLMEPCRYTMISWPLSDRSRG